MRFALRYAAQSSSYVAGRIGQCQSTRLATLPVCRYLYQRRAFTFHHSLREEALEREHDDQRLSKFKESCE